MSVRERIQRAQQEIDETIIAAVLSMAEDRDHVVVKRGTFQAPYVAGVEASRIRCCAVGAALLFRGVNVIDTSADSLELFAAHYSVPREYAEGVSDGFEDGIGLTDGEESFADREEAGGISRDDPHYARGWAVGTAIASALHLVDRNHWSQNQ